MARPREFDEELVLDAVMETFWRHGYEGTSTQALVDSTGLGRGSLYAAYANKDGLFEQALLRYRKRAQAQVEQLRAADLPMQGLREMLESIVDADIDAPIKRGCFATNSAIEMARCDSHVADLVRQNFGILTRGIEETIRRGQKAGEISAKADAGTLALFIFNAVQGLRVLAKATLPQDRGKLAAVIDCTITALK